MTKENEEVEQAEQTQSPYMQSGGHWMYNHPVVEPSGYFDQLYMNPPAYRHEGPEAQKSAEMERDDRTEGQRAMEREILKDKGCTSEEEVQRPPLVVESSSSQSSGAPHRTSSMSTTDASSPDTLATSAGEDEEEMKRFVSEDALPTDKTVSVLAPRLQHSHTDPSKAAEVASQLSRRANSSGAK